MKLLVLTPLVPYPPHDGDKLRFYHFLRHLKSRGHVIDLFCLTRVKEDFKYAANLRPLCRRLHLEHIGSWDVFLNILGGLAHGHSLNISSYFSPKFLQALESYRKTRDWEGLDAVLVHRLRMAPYAFRGDNPKPVLLELTDCLSSYTDQLKSRPGTRWTRKWAAWWDSNILREEEPQWVSRSSISTVVAEPDAEFLGQLCGNREKISVVPNGALAQRPSKSPRPVYYSLRGPNLCFVGNMGYDPNEEAALWFLDRVWPLIQREYPEAVFACVGGQPRKKLLDRDDGRNVHVTGWVPEIEPFLLHASLSLAPLRVASGMQNKVALSMALGVPLVATPQAVKWLPEAGRRLVREGADPDTFAWEVLQALKNPAAARSRAQAAKGYILKHYSWEKSGRELEKLLKEISSPPRAPRER